MTEVLKCERCESDKPAKVYDPRTPGHPNKRVNLCDDCAAKDPKVICMSPEVVPTPVIDPAIPEEKEPDIVEFGPATQPIPEPAQSIPTPKNAPSKPTKEQAIPVHESDLQKLYASKQEILKQLTEVNREIKQRGIEQIVEKARSLPTQLENCERLILRKQGAVAGLKGIE